MFLLWFQRMFHASVRAMCRGLPSRCFVLSGGYGRQRNANWFSLEGETDFSRARRFTEFSTPDLGVTAIIAALCSSNSLAPAATLAGLRSALLIDYLAIFFRYCEKASRNCTRRPIAAFSRSF
jgi:hypothetical protein